MNLLLLYLLLSKATFTSFSGLSSLPALRNDLVVQHKVLTDRQLSAAVATGQTTPGPIGLYVVTVGYFVAGLPGACVGWLAVVTPAFFIIPMLRYLGARAERPAVQRTIRAVTLAAAGLILSMVVPLARASVHGALSWAIAVASLAVLAATRVDTVWVILGAALAGLLAVLI